MDFKVKYRRPGPEREIEHNCSVFPVKKRYPDKKRVSFSVRIQKRKQYRNEIISKFVTHSKMMKAFSKTSKVLRRCKDLIKDWQS